MPVLWTYDAARYLVRVRYVEPVTIPEWREAHDAILDGCARVEPLHWLIDRRDILAPHPEFARVVAAYLMRRRTDFAGSRIAILVAVMGDGGYWMARLQSMLNESSGARTSVFTSEPEALAWLEHVPARSSTAGSTRA